MKLPVETVNFRKLKADIKKGTATKAELELLREQKKISTIQYTTLLEIYNSRKKSCQ